MRGQLSLKLERAADFGRDRFIVSACNREAVSAIDAWPDPRGGALALVGPAGSGKTHLAIAWARRTGADVLQLDVLTEEPALRTHGAVLLDGADEAPHGEAFFHLLNWASRPGCSLLLTGRTAPKTWPVQVADLRSRLNALPVVALGAPDDAVLTGLLVRLFERRSIRPAPDLLTYLVRRIERSAAAAQAIVAALDEAAAEAHRPVSRALAREILRDEGEDNFDDEAGA